MSMWAFPLTASRPLHPVPLLWTDVLSIARSVRIISQKGWGPFVNCSNYKTILIQNAYVNAMGEEAKKNGWNYVAANMLGTFQFL